MASFKDTAGREWLLTISTWELKQVLSKTGVDLGKILDPKLERYSALTSDQVKLSDVIYALCSEQAEKRGVSEEQFYRSLIGDAWKDAADAFEEAFISFCPSHLRKVLKSLRAKMAMTQETATTKAMKAIEELDVFSLVATSSPELSASIPQG